MSDATTFERARRPEQKELRRATILAAASELAAAGGVRTVSLGDIATATGMAKSNLLRYFGTREEIYLQVLVDAATAWFEAFAPLAAANPAAGPGRTAELVAASLAERPLLCDLLSHLAGTLEQNVRPQRGADFKVAMLGGTAQLGTLLAGMMPALPAGKSFEAAGMTVLCAGAIWSTCTTPPEIIALLEAPELDQFPDGFAGRLAAALHAIYAGLPLT